MSHSNNSIYELIEEIIKEQFSEDVFKIAKDLLYQGPSSTIDLMKRLSLDFLSIRNALIILLQNKLIKFEELIRKDSKEIVYEIEIQNVLNTLRFPKILHFINQLFGENSVLIFEEFMQYGILSAGQCIEQIVFKLQSVKNINNTYVNNVKSTFIKLVEENYLTQVLKIKLQELKNTDKGAKNKNSKTKKEAAKGKSPKKQAVTSRKSQKKNSKKENLIEEEAKMEIDLEPESEEDLEEEEQDEKKGGKKPKSLLDDVVDDTNPLIFNKEKNKYYHFYINFEKIKNEMKTNLIVDMISQKINQHAALVFQVILKKNFNYCLNNGKSSPFTANEIYNEILSKNPKSQIKVNKITEIFENLIEEHDFALKWGFDDNNNSLYCLNFENVANKIRSRCLEKMIEQQFTPMHLRVYRLLSKCGALDSKNIMELCLLPQKECTAYLNQMINESFVETQTVNSKGSNLIYYSVNTEANLEYLVAKVYKIIRNLKVFLNKHMDRINNFESQLRKEEYINKVYGSISELDDSILILNINQ